MGSNEESKRNRSKELTVITDSLVELEDDSRLDILHGQMIYISGPMSGVKNYNRELFELAKQVLIDAGLKVLSPLDCISTVLDPTYIDNLRADIGEMIWCEAIAFLPGWLDSIGAKAEMSIAKALAMDAYLLLPKQRVLISMERV